MVGVAVGGENADGHLCRSYARIGCCIGHIRHLVGPWGCIRRWLGTGHSTGLSTDMLGSWRGTGEGRWFHQEAVSQGSYRGLNGLG